MRSLAESSPRTDESASDETESADELTDEAEGAEDAVMLDFLQLDITNDKLTLTDQQMDELEPQATDLDRKIMKLSADDMSKLSWKRQLNLLQ